MKEYSSDSPKSHHEQEGYCILTLREFEHLIIFGCDKPDRLSGDNILIMKMYIKYDPAEPKIKVSLHGRNYEFLRREILNKPYDEHKCRLTEEEFNSLKETVESKIDKLEGRVSGL